MTSAKLSKNHGPFTLPQFSSNHQYDTWFLVRLYIQGIHIKLQYNLELTDFYYRSELDKCQTELHQALSTLVLWTNRHVMLNANSDTEPSALVTPVTQLIQVLLVIFRHSCNSANSGTFSYF